MNSHIVKSKTLNLPATQEAAKALVTRTQQQSTGRGRGRGNGYGHGRGGYQGDYRGRKQSSQTSWHIVFAHS
jgi:hypothetical protein